MVNESSCWLILVCCYFNFKIPVLCWFLLWFLFFFIRHPKFRFLSFVFQQNETGFVVDSSSPEYVAATYVTFNELTCAPPTIGSYEVKIDNNGASLNSGSSGPAYFLVYDSLCYDCNINTLTCVQKVVDFFCWFIHRKIAMYFLFQNAQVFFFSRKLWFPKFGYCLFKFK